MSTTVEVAPEQSSTRHIVNRFVELMERQDLGGVVGLYATDGAWEVHVPGWDDLLTDPIEMLDLHQQFFGRDRFCVERHEITVSGDSAALNWDLTWRDRASGLPAASFQSHFFTIAGGAIRLHRMYCAGVRVYDEPGLAFGDTHGEEGRESDLNLAR